MTSSPRPPKPTKIDISLGFIPTGVEVFVGPAEEFSKFMKGIHPDDAKVNIEEALAACFNHDGFWPIIWLPKYPETPKEIGTLAHECGHAAFYVFEYLGVKASDETSEFFNYLVGWIQRVVLERRDGERLKSQKAKKRGSRKVSRRV